MNNTVLAVKFIEQFAGKSIIIERMSPNSVGSENDYVEEACGICMIHPTEKDGCVEVELEGKKQRYCFFPESVTATSAEGRVNPVIGLKLKIRLA